MHYRCAGLVIGLLCVLFLSEPQAQEPMLDFPAESIIRLTGVLDLEKQPQTSAYPLFAVWLGEKTGQLQVMHVEPVIGEYPAEEELRQVSSLGLRLLAEKEALSTLQDPQMQGRPIVIEGWLEVQQGNLNVRSVRRAAPSQNAPTEKSPAHP